MELGSIYSVEVLNRIIAELCDDLKHLTLQWKYSNFVGRSDKMAHLAFRAGNTISSLALLCQMDLDVVLAMLNRQPLPSLRSLGLGVGGAIETWDVESFDKKITGPSPLSIFLHSPYATMLPFGRQHAAHMSTVPTRRHEWLFIDDMKSSWLEVGQRIHENLYIHLGDGTVDIAREKDSFAASYLYA